MTFALTSSIGFCEKMKTKKPARYFFLNGGFIKFKNQKSRIKKCIISHNHNNIVLHCTIDNVVSDNDK